MAYRILNSNGTLLVSLADSQVDNVTTSLSLIGKNHSGFGEEINNNFVNLLANFSNTSDNPPRNPLTGQLWYDSSVKRLKVYDGGFKSISGAIVSSTQPTNLVSGDLWWDRTNSLLKIWDGSNLVVVNPVVGTSGISVPPANTGTVVGWLPCVIGSNTYRIPLYQ